MRKQEPEPRQRPNFAEIAQRAYELYEGRARIDGLDREDWLAAEDELEGDESELSATESDAPDLPAA